jgi:hypothetical protein
MVWDCFKGEGVHELELNWHCNGEITEVGASKAMMLAELDATMTLTGGRISRHSGEVDPPRGWRAPGYGRRVPITTLTATATTSLPHEFLTVVALAPLRERALAADIEIFRSWLP